MNLEEKTRLIKMEDTVSQIQSDVNEIKIALLGNILSGDKGFKGQIETINAELETLKLEIKTLRDERVKNEVYVLIIKGLLGLFGAGLLAYIFNK